MSSRKLYFLSLVVILFGRAEPFWQFWWRLYEENSCEIILYLGQYFRRCRLKIQEIHVISIFTCSSSGQFVWPSETVWAIW